jgi:hypothetical protein
MKANHQQNWKVPTVFDLTDVPNDNVTDLDLLNLSTTDCCKFMLVFNLALKPPKLSFLFPVVKSRDEYDDDDGKQNGGTLNPAMLLFMFMTVLWNIDNAQRTLALYHNFMLLLTRTLYIRIYEVQMPEVNLE